MDTEWTWAHYSEDNPQSAPLNTGESYPSQAEARQALARYIASLGSPHTEDALRQLRETPADENAILVVEDAVFTTRVAGSPYGEPQRQRRGAQPDAVQPPDAVRPIGSGNARIRPKDVPLPMRLEGFAIGLCVVAGFLMTETGIRAWAQPENNVASPILALPGLILFFGAFAWTANWRRRAGAHLARRGRTERR